MSRYKISYSKSSGILSGTTWYCYIYDRKYEIEYSGSGNTKKEAKDDAWDSVWRNKGNSNNDTSSGSDTQGSGNATSDFVAFPMVGGSIGLFISFIIAFYKGCGLFHFDPNTGNSYLFDIEDAKEGFLIIPIICVTIGLVIAIIYYFKKSK